MTSSKKVGFGGHIAISGCRSLSQLFVYNFSELAVVENLRLCHRGVDLGGNVGGLRKDPLPPALPPIAPPLLTHPFPPLP